MIKRFLCVLTGALLIGGCAGTQAWKGVANSRTIIVNAGEVERENTPVCTKIDLDTSLDRALLVGGNEKIEAQIEKGRDGTRLLWVQPHLRAGESRQYKLVLGGAVPEKQFQYHQGKGYRDLQLGDQPVIREMFKYQTEEKDKNKSSKPFIHVFGMNGEGLITKGSGGMESHHRGIFLGFGTQYGNFWDCSKPGVDQHHVAFEGEREFVGPVVARSVETTNWIAQNKLIVDDRRMATIWNAAPGEIVMDFDLKLNSNAGDVQLMNNSHHAGFHFRAAEEVEGPKPGLHAGTATYVRPATAKLNKDDEWRNCPWVACRFAIKGHPYVLMHMDWPTNPVSVYSTRPYGRFGASFNGTLREGKPMDLKYRVIVFDAEKHPELDLAEFTQQYLDFVSPIKVEVK